MIRFHALPWMDRAVAWQVPMVRVMPRGSVTGQGGGGCHRSKIACCSRSLQGSCGVGGAGSRQPCSWGQIFAAGMRERGPSPASALGGRRFSDIRGRPRFLLSHSLPSRGAGCRSQTPPPAGPRRPRLHHAPLCSPLRSSDRPTSRRRAGVCKDQGLWGGVPSLLHKPSRGVGCVLRSQTPGSRASHTPSRRAVLLLASHPSGPALI